MAEARRRVHEHVRDRARARGAVPRAARAPRSVGEARSAANGAAWPPAGGRPLVPRSCPRVAACPTSGGSRRRESRSSLGFALLLLAVGGYTAARETSLFAVQAVDVRGGTPAIRAQVRRRPRGRSGEEPPAGRRGHARAATRLDPDRARLPVRPRVPAHASHRRQARGAAPRSAPGRPGVPRRGERTGHPPARPPAPLRPAAAVGDEGRARRGRAGAAGTGCRGARGARAAARRLAPVRSRTRCASVRTR